MTPGEQERDPSSSGFSIYLEITHQSDTESSVTLNLTLTVNMQNIKTNSQKIRECTYKTLVRPQVEYAGIVWDPHTRSNIDRIEMVQRRAARWTLGEYTRQTSVSALLDRLGWRSLEQRRADERLCLFYKIVNGLVAVSVPEYIVGLNRVSRHNHSLGYIHIHTGASYYKYSFFPLSIVFPLGPLSMALRHAPFSQSQNAPCALKKCPLSAICPFIWRAPCV